MTNSEHLGRDTVRKLSNLVSLISHSKSRDKKKAGIFRSGGVGWKIVKKPKNHIPRGELVMHLVKG